MPIINKTSSQLVFDQINGSNPDVEVKFAPENLKLNTPQQLTTGNVTNFNTRIKASGLNDVYTNSVNIDLRRLDVALLTRGVAIRVYRKAPIAIVATPKRVFRLYDLLPAINKMYGFNFTEDDVFNADIIASIGSPKIDGQYSSTVTVTTKPTSVAYYGSFQCTWVQSADQLQDLLAGGKNILNGRLYPAGNDFIEGRKPVGEWQLYGLDATPVKAAAGLETYTAVPGSLVAVGATHAYFTALLAFLNGAIPDISWSLGSHTQVGGLGGLIWARAVLPNASHPEANSTDFNRAIIFTAKGDSWFSGKIILHYNA